MAPWRWWDGTTWTAHIAGNQRRPRLPQWLSVPVIMAAVLTGPMLLYLLVTTPASVSLGVVPVLIVLPVLMWLDRVEPEPRMALVHAFLWGATVAVAISSIVNVVFITLVNETLGIVVTAPIIEEATKAAGILWAVRRREVDGVMDGIVYAGWVALGFAVIEDITYFADAANNGVLAQTFVVRALLGPFAHPLFTAWSGLAIGQAISRGRRPMPAALWGYGLAVATHAAWNGSLAASATWSDSAAVIILVAIGGFVVLFLSFVSVLYRIRRREERRFIQLVPWLARRYGLSPAEISSFGNFRAMLAIRKTLDKAQRRQFDAVHAALARLAVLHDRPGETDVATEQLLVDQLQRARSGRPRS
jgi:RsiW-degrading membrane proteinase PrsW (M82 family)